MIKCPIVTRKRIGMMMSYECFRITAAPIFALPPMLEITELLPSYFESAEFRSLSNKVHRNWPDPNREISGMDRAVAEIVEALDGKNPFPYSGIEGLRTLEAIVAFHASHARNAAWTELPLAGADRDILVNSG